MGEVPRVPPPFPHQQRLANPSPVVFEPIRDISPLPHITERPFVTASPPLLASISDPRNTDEIDRCWLWLGDAHTFLEKKFGTSFGFVLFFFLMLLCVPLILAYALLLALLRFFYYILYPVGECFWLVGNVGGVG